MTRRPHDLLPGDCVGSLRVVEEIGRGAFGAVYRAHDEVIGRDVALKVVGGLELDDARWALIEREIKVLGRLAHPNIVTLHHIHVTDDGRRMLEMELVEGMDLEERLELEGPLPPDEAIRIAQGVCGALGAAHEQGIVHRDIKPANVMLGTNGAIKLLDFGLGRDVTEATRSASADHLVGTPHYMAPELLQNERASPASDVWSMGVLLYRVLTGRLPFDADSITNLFHVIHAGQPPELDASVPAPLRRAVTACLQRDVAARPASANELATLLGGGSLAPGAARDVPPPLGEPVQQRLFGRDALVAELEGALTAASAGHGSRHVLLGAEAVGKSAVLDAALRHARRSEGAAFRVEVDRLVGLRRALADTLRRGADNILAHDPVQVIQFALEALSAQAARGPVVVGIDDLDQANRDDLALLLHLLRALDATPVMLVLALRSGGDVSEGGPLTELLRHPGIEVHALEPLDEDASHELITAHWAPRLVDATLRAELVRRGGGFPGLLLEVMREAEASRRVELSESRVVPAASWRGEEAPLRLREVVLARLDRLSSDDRDLLEVACVAGQRFSTDWIAEALSVPRLDALRRLQRLVRAGGWIESTPAGGAFTSGVVRGAVYGSVIPELRRELHRLLAIRESAEANDDPTTLERAARHWLRCDEEARAVDTGLRTIGLLPRGETVRSIDLADGLGVLDRAPTEGECLAHWGDLCRLASCLIDAGRHEQASQLLGALDVASDSASISDAQRAHLSLRQAAWRQWNEGVSSLSVDDLQDAASKLQGTPDGRQALYILALRLRAGDEPDLAVRVLQDLTDDADAAGDALSAARAFLALGGVLRSRYRLDEAAHNYQRARELFSQCHHVINVAVCDVNLAMVALAAGQFRAALAQASGAWNVLERSGARGLADQAAMICSDVLLSQGNFRDAAAWAAPRLQSTAVLTRCDAALQMAHISGVQQNDASEYLCLAGEALTEAPDRESRNRLQIERLYLCRLAPEDFPGLVRVLDQRIEFLGDSPSERILLLVRLSQLACEGLFPPRDLLRGWPRCLKALPRAHRRTALGLLRALRAQEGPCTRVPDSRLVASLLGQGHAELELAWRLGASAS